MGIASRKGEPGWQLEDLINGNARFVHSVTFVSIGSLWGDGSYYLISEIYGLGIRGIYGLGNMYDIVVLIQTRVDYGSK